MRLTLRTLLSYLDDTLEPAQAKAIGAKVAESDTARELAERIKTVTRKRRLTTPPTTGPGGIDPNTIAEYLDNDVTPEQSTEVEQICLASEVHLAEVAACHQILTLVLGEPALVPPSAKQRMYQLVKGPESIPFRKPPKASNKDDQDLSSELEPDQDDTLRIGVPAGGGLSRNLWLVIGGGVLAACLLAVAVWQVMTPPPGEVKTPDPLAQNDPKDPNKKTDPAKEDDTAKKKKIADDKKAADEKKAADDKAVADKKALDDKKIADDMNPSKEPKVFKVERPDEPEIPSAPPLASQDPVGVFVPPTKDEPGVLLRKLAKTDWTRVADKNAKISSGIPLLAMSGSKGMILLDSGVELTLWGNLPEVTDDHRVLESRATLHTAPALLDGDLTLDRGRIILRNKKATGNALIRVRFDNPTLSKMEYADITLYGADAAVIVERFGSSDGIEPFYDDPKDVLRKGPIGAVNFFGYKKYASVRYNDNPWSLNDMNRRMLLWVSRTGTLAPPEKAKLPDWLTKAPEVKDKVGADKARLAHLALVKILETRPLDVALAEIYQTMQKNAEKETAGRKLLSPDTFALWRHAIRSSAAVDDMSRVYEDFVQENTPFMVRGQVCLNALQRWMAWNRDQDYELLKVVRKFHSPVLSVKVLELLHGVSPEEAHKPGALQHLVDGLDNSVLPIRTLSHYNLLMLGGQYPEFQHLQPGGSIPFDPAMSRVERAPLVQAWARVVSKMPMPPKK